MPTIYFTIYFPIFLASSAAATLSSALLPLLVISIDTIPSSLPLVLFCRAAESIPALILKLSTHANIEMTSSSSSPPPPARFRQPRPPAAPSPPPAEIRGSGRLLPRHGVEVKTVTRSPEDDTINSHPGKAPSREDNYRPAAAAARAWQG